MKSVKLKITKKAYNLRLRVIRDLLKEELPELKVDSKLRSNNPQTWNFNNPAYLSTAIMDLEKLNLFDSYIEPIKELGIFPTKVPSLVLDQPTHLKLSKYIGDLRTATEGLIYGISQTIELNDENIVSIKIPPPKNFAELGKISTRLEKIFSQTIYHEDIGGSITIKNFDTGSYWIDILANSATTVTVIGGLAYSGAIVFKVYQEGRLLQEKVREMKISNEAAEEIEEKSDKEVDRIAEVEANYVYDKYYKSNKDPEQISRIKFALKELAVLNYNGGEIHPSLHSSKEIKETFPNYQRLEKIESRIEKLEQRTKKKK
ncbi:hypothetical protein RM549_06075 [Salegentibacter sp. F188]|uniref:Uncharacterized protein n=1 Tax=Autumnicola patrickiae TaxID=3075591 RepID=A0ABU3E022_9FLAO|nr:hypothetical protein [Salegentibacter sp. F188]MDT0689344.1 hypothetical protein [Salegentibacter sp. F188]